MIFYIYSSHHLFDQLFEEYRKTTDVNYKFDIRDALTHTTGSELIYKIIKQFKNDNTIKLQDLLGWFRCVMINDKRRIPAWKWIRDEWNWLKKSWWW